MIDVERLIDAGNVIVMQGHYVAKAKATGHSVCAMVAHVVKTSDGKIVRFDQYVDCATIWFQGRILARRSSELNALAKDAGLGQRDNAPMRLG